jgi:RNA polymerase sigma-70 factor (ECF subfamily)
VTRRLDEYRSSGAASFFLWVRFLTGQKLHDLHRRHLGAERRDRHKEISTPFPAASSLSLAEALLDPASSPSDVVARAEEQQRLQEALESLDEGDREVLVLRYFELLTNEETAEVLGLSHSGAKKRHLRALGRLKAALGPLEGLWRPPGGA